MPSWLNWLHALKPANAGEAWTAIAAIVAALALFFAARSAWYAARTLRIEQTPVLTLEHEHDSDRVVIRNVGRGVTFVAFVTDEDGNLLDASSAIAPGEATSVDATKIEFSPFKGQFVYGQDIAGRWTRTFAVYQGLERSKLGQFNNRIDGTIGRWRRPRRALRDLRRSHRSILQHVHKLGGYFNTEAWSYWLTAIGVQTRIAFFKWWYGIGERSRLRRFSGRADKHPSNQVPPEKRALWPIDIDGLMDCWKGPRFVRQLSCEWESDLLVCEIFVHSAALPYAGRGLLVIERAAYGLLSEEERDTRSDLVRRKFGRYICGLRPKDRFAFVLRKFGPWLINDRGRETRA